ncbi:MAG: hypothetical protein J2P30_07020, partial [Actinobacteria bacterium]|nr:hypothetical protein [Actinomycetota bacterium]
MDELLRRELLARQDEDQRVRSLGSLPKGQYTVRLSDEQAAEWERVDTENTRWLGPRRETAALRHPVHPDWRGVRPTSDRGSATPGPAPRGTRA